jgi:dTDP-4-dehydrorhamnose reductase
MKIAVTGLSGLLGRSLLRSWNPDDVLIDLYHTTPAVSTSSLRAHLDLTQRSTIQSTLERVQPDMIVHMAAMTHIDACERDKEHGKHGIVWQINVEASKEIGNYAAVHNVHLLLLSTECIFDGTQESYKEQSEKHPKNWYGQTKSAAEDVLLSLGLELSILRSVVAYHPTEPATIFGKIVSSYQEGKRFPVVSDQYFTPTYVEDITAAIQTIIKRRLLGIFHVAPSDHLTPQSFALEIGKHFGYDTSLVQPQTLLEYFGNERASLRLKHACLDATASQKTIQRNAQTVKEVLYTIPT